MTQYVNGQDEYARLAYSFMCINELLEVTPGQTGFWWGIPEEEDGTMTVMIMGARYPYPAMNAGFGFTLGWLAGVRTGITTLQQLSKNSKDGK